jgi:lysyl-tRNA synthetase class 1
MVKKAAKGTFWADAMAEEILQHVDRHPRLETIVSDQGLLVYDEKTPSGTIHIGSSRGWILHDVIARALRARGATAHFVLSSDDMDPYDKPSASLPRDEWDQHLGKPFRHMPSPEPGFESYGDFYFRQCTDLFDRYSIDAGLESTGALYEAGAFDATIQRALDQTSEVQAIYTDLYGDTPASHRLPFNPLCESCGRIGTTRALEWDGARGLIRYECRSDILGYKDSVTRERVFIEGCGHSGWRSPMSGGGKFPWKVEWAAKWITKGVIAEWAGKDHFSKGGSRTAACRFSVDIFDFPPPYPSDRYRTGGGYEFLNVSGRKMSTSKGAGVGFAEVTEVLSPSMLRFLMVRSEPHKVIDFDPNRTADIVNLYTEHDRTERVAHGVITKEPEALAKKLDRVHFFTYPDRGDLTGQDPPARVKFALAAIVGQSVETSAEAVSTLRAMGHLPPDRGDEETVQRVAEARSWLAFYAKDSKLRISLNDSVPPAVELDDASRAVFAGITSDLQGHVDGTAPLTEQAFKGRMFAHIGEAGLEQRPFFALAYQTLLGRPDGPPLSSFLMSLGARALPLLRECSSPSS